MPKIVPPELKDASVQWSTGTSRKANKPGESEPGDVLLEIVGIDLVGADITLPEPYERIGTRVEQVGGVDFQVAAFWAIEDGSPDATITWDGTSHFCVSMQGCLRHAPHKAPVDFSLFASPEARKLVRGHSLNVATDGSLAVMIGIAQLDVLTEYLEVPPGMLAEVNAASYLMAAESPLPTGETGDRDAQLSNAQWNVGGLFIFEPKPVPGNTEAPVLSGTPAAGETLSVTHGSWSNDPLSYEYQWQVSCRGGSYMDLPDSTGMTFGADTTGGSLLTNSTFEIPEGYDGRSVRCLVRATNEGGSEVEPSNALSLPGVKGPRIKRVAMNVGGRTVIPGFGNSAPIPVFAPETIDDYFIYQAREGAITEVPDPAGSEETALKFVVRNDDGFPVTPTVNPRAQLDSPFMLNEGAVYELEGAFWVPANWPDNTGQVEGNDVFIQLFQFFGAPYEGSPPWGLKFQQDELTFQRNQVYGYDKPWGTRAWKKEHWTAVKIRALQAKDGWLEMWIDGEQVTFFDPDDGKFGTYNPNHEPMGKRLYMETIDSSNFEQPNLAVIQSYRKIDSFEELTMYHKHLIVRAI